MTGRDAGLDALLARVAVLGVELLAQGDRLQCRGPRRLLTRELQAELAARKHEILEQLRRTQVAAGDAPLSYAQQRLWFLDQMAPGTAAYNLPMAERLRGPLDARALEAALLALVCRHEILRSRFPVVDGAPVQRVMPPPEAMLARADLRHLPQAEREEQALRLAREALRQPFDLASGPLLRAGLIALDDNDHVFTLCAHHMVADGWSVALIGSEIAAAYAAAAGAPSPEDGPVTQYAAYARWQREALADAQATVQQDYWMRALAAAPRVLALPADRPRPPVPSHRGARVEFALEAPLTAALRRLCEESGATLFMLLLAAGGVLLGRHARAGRVVIATPIAGRNRPEWGAIVGCFVNTLAMQVDLTGDPTFAELLGRVRAVALDAYDHQDLPFERVVEALQPERDLSRNPIAQVSIGLHNAPGQAPLATIPLPGLAAAAIDPAPGTVRFDLELDVWEVAGGLHARLLYATDLFDAASAQRLAAQLRELLAAVAADPHSRISRLSLLDAEERAAAASLGRSAQPLQPDGRPLDALVREQALRAPGAIALACGEEAITYAELVARADAMVLALRAAGVMPGDAVGLCAARGAPAIVGMLGILASGAAYVPVDPEHPQARVALVLDDSRARVVAVEPHLVPRFDGAALRIVPIGAPGPASGAAFAAPAVHPESLAYLMYTSGSTGRPKGVAVPHRAVTGLLEAMHRVLPLGPGDVFLAVTTFAFDISVLEVFLPLTRGARLALATREETLDAQRLAQAIARHGAIAMQATPATWSLLVEAGWQGTPEMSALCGGEALPPGLAAALRARCARVWNVYGPTETTIWSAADEVRAGEPVTIGRALANGEVHVLDESLEPLPPGMVGEIWIGGHGVARGYHGRPGLTAGAFRPDPFSRRAGARMYRTGDLGRRREDGRIECLGRIDQQVKLRGFRIEPGDVEAALLAHGTVAHAVVLLVGEGAEQRLAAHVVAAPGMDLDVQALRRHLQERLPAYLVPGSIVALETLPTTPNGKIDRAALAAAPRAALPAPAALVPAGSAVERELAGIWSSVLKVDGIGMDDNFFDLGGHSLLLAKVRAAIAERLGREVAVLDLFRWPTIRGLASHLEGATAAATGIDAAEAAAQQAAAIRRLARAAEEARASHD
jgi:amino acid adenylation domain-containing protein